MKNFKTKKIVLGTVMALSAVSLASVGFAGWVINGVMGTDSRDITTSVGTIEDKSITAKITAEDLELRFDYIEASKLPPKDTYNLIYQNGSDNKVEKLSVSVTYEISLSANSTEKDVKNVCSGVELKFKLSPKFNEAITNGYIAVDFGTAKENTDASDASTYDKYYVFNVTATAETNELGVKTEWTVNPADTTKVSAKSTFTFKWGANFGGHNPCYVLKSGDTVTDSDIKTNLKAFVDNYKKDGLKGQIVVTPTLK